MYNLPYAYAYALSGMRRITLVLMHILIQPPSSYKSLFRYKTSDGAETHDPSTHATNRIRETPRMGRHGHSADRKIRRIGCNILRSIFIYVHLLIAIFKLLAYPVTSGPLVPNSKWTSSPLKPLELTRLFLRTSYAKAAKWLHNSCKA